MARFTVRVVLHNAAWERYEAMYILLEQAGFTDTIRGGDGVLYRMPPAEYDFDGNATMDQVFRAAASCAAAVVNGYAVFVTESAGRQWDGLERIV